MSKSAPPKPIDPIWVTPPPKQRLDPIERWFIVVLRVVALVLIARALHDWFVIIGFLEPRVVARNVDAYRLFLALMTIMTSVAVIAGVGLWLLAPWGAVLWLVLVAADALFFFLAPGVGLVGPTLILLNAGLICVYLGMLLQVRRHEQSVQRPASV